MSQASTIDSGKSFFNIRAIQPVPVPTSNIFTGLDILFFINSTKNSVSGLGIKQR